MSIEGDKPSPKELAQDLARLEGNLRSSMSNLGRAEISDRLRGTHHDLPGMEATEQGAHKALERELHKINDMARGNPELLKAIYAETKAIDDKSGYYPEIKFENGQLIFVTDSKEKTDAVFLGDRG
jgi:hypothetical protein